MPDLWYPVTRSGPTTTRLTATVPSTMPDGDYHVYVRNSSSQLSNPQRLTIE